MLDRPQAAADSSDRLKADIATLVQLVVDQAREISRLKTLLDERLDERSSGDEEHHSRPPVIIRH